MWPKDNLTYILYNDVKVSWILSFLWLLFTALHTQGWKTGICDDVYNLVRSDKTAEVAVPRGSLVVVDNYSDFDPSMCPVS